MKEKTIASKIAYSSMLIALSVIFSYVETLAPFSVGVPGIKLGLANLVVLLGLYFLPVRQVAAISFVRIVLNGLMYGGPMAIVYSLAGALCSFLLMVGLKKKDYFSMIGVSIAGGVMHNLGQLCVAIAIVQTKSLLFYAPVLIAAGAACGLVIGLIGRQCKIILQI